MNDTPTDFEPIFQELLRALRFAREHQPSGLQEKYRQVDWSSDRAQSALRGKLTALLANPAIEPKRAIASLQNLLRSLFVSAFFTSPNGRQLLATLRSHLKAAPSPPAGIAILLLDAENLQLDRKTEKFLTSVCHCPLQVKIAFANWQSLGKLDRELHARGYDLLHVPGGRDHADGKMIAVGLALRDRYPSAREVLVCSSDTVMTTLCNHLQQQGLGVYRVQKQGDLIEVLNRRTNQKQTFLPDFAADLPSVETFRQQLEEIIQLEQQRDGNQWIKLSAISQQFRNRSRITISHVVSHYWPGKRARDFFLDRPEEFVVHQPSETTELYIALFENSPPPSEPTEVSDRPNPNTRVSEDLRVSTLAKLEKRLIKILKKLSSSPSDAISIGDLAAVFYKQSGEGINKVLERIDLNLKFINFLDDSPAFKLEKDGSLYRVSAIANTGTTGNKLPISSPEQLEETLLEILKKFNSQSGQPSTVEGLASEFYKQYGEGITTVLKQLNLNVKFSNFLRNSKAFKLKKHGTSYRVLSSAKAAIDSNANET